MKRDKRIDAYITRSLPFARPVLKKIRALVHRVCPSVEETIKWNFPHFLYRGKTLIYMASFKEHCALGFWNASRMTGLKSKRGTASTSAMGNFGRITQMTDLPSDAQLTAYIREAVRLAESGVTPKYSVPSKNKKINVPSYFLRKLKENNRADRTFLSFSYSNKKEYVEWITDAKTEATKLRRMEKAITWLAEGKVRNWKYMKKHSAR